MNTMLKSIHENLQQLVFDEDKIVTYKLLTRLLKINVNVAKKYLQDFFELNRKELNAFYILIGLQKSEIGQPFTKIIVVPAVEVDETKKSFVKVTSSHIYCIHKGELVDKLAVFTADCEGQAYNRSLNEYSAIRNPHVRIESKRRNIKPTIKQEIKNLPQVTTKKQVEEKKNGDIERMEKKDSISPSKKKPIKSDDASNSINSKHKSSNIFSMFQKMQSEKKAGDQKVQKNDSATSGMKKTAELNKNQTTKTDHKDKDIKHLFTKQIGKGAQLLSEQNSERAKCSRNANKKREHSRSSSTKQKRISIKQKEENDSDSDESGKPKKKKHKRIVEMEDSESESENEESVDRAQRELVQCEPDVSAFTSCPVVKENLSEDDDCIPPTPVTDGKKKKKWKLVTKTTVDKNEFLVTVKTQECVTDSEGSDNEDKKESKSLAALQPVKKAPFTNRKQTSLMSFFGKK